LSTSLSDLAVVGSTFFSAEALGSPFGFQSFGGSENPINLPVSLISDLLGFLHIGGSEGQEKPYQTDHGLHWIYPILGVRLISGQHSAGNSLAKPDDAPQSGVVLARYIAIPFSELPQDVNQPPGNGFTEKKDQNQNYVNPNTGQSLHPDPTHRGLKGPHYDLHNGRLEPKGKVSLRQFNDQLQYWAPDVEQWIELEGPTLFPIE
jgi:hypothetical protein